MDQTFQEFLASQSAQIPLLGFVINLLLAALLSYVLRGVYIRYGNSLSNRRAFARNLILMAVTTMLIITVVKSSLALSLGLVGALSIVRFRAAIKEPEELAYLFLAISIGLGLGADQRVITLVAFVIIVGIIWLMKYSSRSEENQNLYLTVSSHNPEKVGLETIVQILKDHCDAVSLKRFDDTKEMLEAAFLVEFEDYPHLEAARASLLELGDDVRVTFLENRGIGGL
ncbi:MAG: DUF4956 domain-containing protein [Anaerolineales bacterium]|jgi:hypothetical protein